MRKPISRALVAVFLCLCATCADASVRVAASIFPLSAIAREIGGERVTVTTIVPSGSDPHHYELTPKKAKALFEADVVFLIGGHFDDWVMASEEDAFGDCLTIRFHEAFTESLFTVGHSFNPHFWLDPLYAKSMGKIVGGALCASDPAGCDYYWARTRAFVARVDSLDASVAIRIEASGFTGFVAFHPAWTYFAKRYGLREHGTIEISHEQEPSAKHIADLIEKMRDNEVRFILSELFSNPELAEGIAAQTGAALIVLDPLGDADIPDRSTYFKLIDYNVSVIEESMRAER
jgi:zinc transport system substrate-binding protein